VWGLFASNFCVVAGDEADVVSSYFTLNKKKRYNLMAFLRSAQESILPQRVKKSY
jgi:hypothetical protein